MEIAVTIEMENSNWHWMWSKFYYLKKHLDIFLH